MQTRPETGISLRTEQTLIKEIEEIYDRVSRRAHEIFLKRGCGDPTLEIEDWIAAERELVAKPAARVLRCGSRVEISVNLASCAATSVEVVVSPRNILVWSPGKGELRGIFRIVRLDPPIRCKSVEARIEDDQLILNANTVSGTGNEATIA